MLGQLIDHYLGITDGPVKYWAAHAATENNPVPEVVAFYQLFKSNPRTIVELAMSQIVSSNKGTVACFVLGKDSKMPRIRTFPKLISINIKLASYYRFDIKLLGFLVELYRSAQGAVICKSKELLAVCLSQL